MHGCLGRRPSPNDRRTLQLAAYVDPHALTAPPPARAWSMQGGHRIPISMFSNDQLGDCTCAAIGHQDQITARQMGTTSPLVASDVEVLYRGSGWTPTDPSSDQGWSNLEAAKAAKKSGWIEGFAKFDHGNKNFVQLVINAFDAAYVGADLPLAAQKQMGGEWDVAPAGSRDSSYDRGTWGGHAMSAVDFNHRGVLFATWGGYQFATWSWWFTYVDEGLALLNRWSATRDLTPAGIRIDELRADIAKISTGPWV